MSSQAPALAGAFVALWLVAVADRAEAGALYSDDFESGAVCGWSDSVGVEPDVLFAESFAANDGDPWPAPWEIAGGVDLAEVDSGRGRLRPFASGYSLARMAAPIDAIDVEALFTLRFENVATQGIGLYLRQNGGWLDDTNPMGQGYAVFVEGAFRGLPGVSLWKEEDGVEIELQNGGGGDLAPAVATDYRVRFRVRQIDATSTELAAKLWAAAAAEPSEWTVTTVDATAEALQGTAGGIAIDSWSVVQSPNPIPDAIAVDEIAVHAICSGVDR